MVSFLRILLLIVFFLIPLVSADTTFFDQDDSFIMSGKESVSEDKGVISKKHVYAPETINETDVDEEIVNKTDEKYEEKKEIEKFSYKNLWLIILVIIVLIIYYIKKKFK